MVKSLNNNINKIAVFYGGDSSEREISLSTGKEVFDALKRKDFDATLFDIPQDLNLFFKKKDSFDLVFIALHGDLGENGGVQGMLEVLGVPFTGSGVLGSALAMDKVQAKSIWQKNSLPVIDGFKLPKNTSFDKASKLIKDFGFPCFLKPVAEGSSRDVFCLNNHSDLKALSGNIKKNFLKKTWMIERRVIGREFAVSIINDDVMPIVEIKPNSEFYSFEDKYNSDKTKYICPANLTSKQADEIKVLAKTAFDAINCEHWGRVDFMMDEAGIYLLEANTVPGLTPSSLVPKSAKAVGIDFDDLVESLLYLKR